MGQSGRSFSNREFSVEEIELIKEIVGMYPRLAPYEIAATVCENLGWTTPAGSAKQVQCLQFLELLANEGVIKLPRCRPYRTSKVVRLPEIHEETAEITGSLANYPPIRLELANPGRELKRWRAYIDKYHYLGDKQVFGSRLHYFIKSGERELGCLQFSASSWILAAREEWIGWDEADRKQRLHLIVNNSRFLIFPWVKIRNLASKILSFAAKQLGKDWLAKYCYEPVLLETFVDTEKFSGICYKAANWIYIGQTAGRGRMDRWHRNEESIKAIYMYPLKKDFRAYLKGEKGYQVVTPD